MVVMPVSPWPLDRRGGALACNGFSTKCSKPALPHLPWSLATSAHAVCV